MSVILHIVWGFFVCLFVFSFFFISAEKLIQLSHAIIIFVIILLLLLLLLLI